MKRRHSVILVVIALSFFLPASCSKLRPIESRRPIARNGVLDLSGYNIRDKGLVRMDGQWTFYWHELLTPKDFAEGKGRNGRPVSFPGYWIDSQLSNKSPELHGYATYRLLVNGLETGQLYGLEIPDMSHSYRLWVNGELIATNGVVGTNRFTTRNDAVPYVRYFRADKSTAEIVLQIANFAGFAGGCSEPILLGSETDVTRYQQDLLILEVFLSSVLLILALYHFVLYFFIVRRAGIDVKRPKKIPFILYFSLICLLLGIHSGFTKQRFILDMIPGIPWSLNIRTELVSWIGLLFAFAAFLNDFFTGFFSRRISRLFEIASVTLLLFVIFAPANFVSYAETPFEILGVLFICYSTYVLVNVAIKKESDPAASRRIESARIILAGLVLFILTAMNDFLYRDSYFIRHGTLTYIGVILLVMFVSFAIVWRFPEIFFITRQKRPRQGKGILMAMIEAGGGHKSPAMATKEAMEELFPGKYDITVSDFTKDVGAIEVDEKHKKQWQFLLANPAVTMVGYYIQDTFGFITRAFLKEYIEPFIRIGGEWLRKNPPQVFVSFHFMNTVVAIEARKKYDLNFPIVTYLTEPMDAHSMWVWKETDIMIVSSKTAKYQLVQRGFPEEKVFIVPYPVRPSFFKISMSRKNEFKKLGLNPAYKTILFSSGAEGLGRIVTYSKALIRSGLPLNVIVICGKNARLKAELDELKATYTGGTNFVPMGYVTNMNEMLNLCDIAAIKASPGSTFEALLLNKAVIHMQYVTPSEKANTKFILKHKIGWYAPTTGRFMKTVRRLIEDDTYFDRYLNNLKTLKLQNGSYEMAKLIDWIAFI